MLVLKCLPFFYFNKITLISLLNSLELRVEGKSNAIQVLLILWDIL